MRRAKIFIKLFKYLLCYLLCMFVVNEQTVCLLSFRSVYVYDESLHQMSAESGAHEDSLVIRGVACDLRLTLALL